ncbi:hypothetical protein ACOME3_000554 [Neoechinorhynchus agilis]
MSKLITINVGEAGNRIGDAYWRLMCAEHGIRLDGRFRGTNEQLQFVDTLFDTNTYNRLNPRAILLDSDRSPIENILDQGRSLYTADRCIMGNEGGSDNFARLYFSEAAPLLERTLNIIRSDFERNDSIQGFQVIHSAAGGCGAGLTGILLELLRTSYPEKSITTLTALPSVLMGQLPFDSYNTVFTLSELIFNTEFDGVGSSIIFDNSTLLNICERQDLDLRPDFMWKVCILERILYFC